MVLMGCQLSNLHFRLPTSAAREVMKTQKQELIIATEMMQQSHFLSYVFRSLIVIEFELYNQQIVIIERFVILALHQNAFQLLVNQLAKTLINRCFNFKD